VVRRGSNRRRFRRRRTQVGNGRHSGGASRLATPLQPMQLRVSPRIFFHRSSSTRTC
jgi:hypothetical protein